MKRLCVIALWIALMILPAQAATSPTPTYASGDYTYVLLSDDEIQIVCWDGDATAVDVPESLDGHTVASISECAFADCPQLKAVTLPETVREIGDGAFTNCTYLSSVALPEGLQHIGSAAFVGCEGLTAIALPASLTALDGNPFEGCGNLCDITVDPDNPTLYIEGGVLFSREDARLVCFPMGRASTRYQVPDGVAIIGAKAFDRDLSLEQVTLPATLTAIEADAFEGCSALQPLELPAGVNVG